jgi:hypothetical protein
MFNHIEYDTNTLADEFLRDRQAGKPVRIPATTSPKMIHSALPEMPGGPMVSFSLRIGSVHRSERLQVRREALIGWTLGARVDHSSSRINRICSLRGRTASRRCLLRILANAGTSPNGSAA